jgi:hypothetical protein
LDFAKWCRDADPADVDKLTAAWGKDPSNWPVVGCTKRFQPFAKGHAMVVEFKTSGDEWKAFRADIIPEIVDAAVKKHQVAFNKAAKCLKPEEVYDLIPRTYPKANPVALAGFDEFPGLGKFDYKVWEQENQSVLDTVGWLKLVLLVANNNLVDLEEVFSTADKQLKSRGITYVPSGKSDAVGELLMVKFD